MIRLTLFHHVIDFAIKVIFDGVNNAFGKQAYNLNYNELTDDILGKQVVMIDNMSGKERSGTLAYHAEYDEFQVYDGKTYWRTFYNRPLAEKEEDKRDYTIRVMN